jgi:transposase
MTVQHIVGADLSKNTIDLVCHTTGDYLQIENKASGFQILLAWIDQQGIAIDQTLLVMEHTGLYSLLLEQFLSKHDIAFKKVNALEIKRSIGMVRGKSDRIDAVRIATYGFEKKEKLTAQIPVSPQLKRLQMLQSTRERLVRQRAGLTNAVKEYRHIDIQEQDLLIKSQLQVIKALDKQITRLEQEVEKIVAEDEAISTNYRLLQSIKGVGKIVALATIIKTSNFTRFTNSRKFACYCGTAPFEHSSGSSIHKRSRISHLADKQMKTLLDLAAKSAIRYDSELKNFYQRRLLMGKSKMSTINIVRNKILYRMFAVAKRQTPFVDNYIHQVA